MKKYTCVCCGYQTLNSGASYSICTICYWEDEPDVYDDPNLTGGPNGSLSLREAQQNFLKYRACEPIFIDIVREPTDDEKIDNQWKPFLDNYWFLR